MKRRDVAYYRQRQKNRVFTALVEFVAQEAKRRGITKKELAESLSKDPSQVTRWLSSPSNFELDTLSDLLLVLDAEMDHRIVRFSDRLKPNYAHPLISQSIHDAGTIVTESRQHNYDSAVVSRAPADVKVKVVTAAST